MPRSYRFRRQGCACDQPSDQLDPDIYDNAGFVVKGSIDVLRNPDDDYSLRIWSDKVQDYTDRFVLLFEKL